MSISWCNLLSGTKYKIGQCYSFADIFIPRLGWEIILCLLVISDIGDWRLMDVVGKEKRKLKLKSWSAAAWPGGQPSQ